MGSEGGGPGVLGGGGSTWREAWDSLGASGKPTGKCHSTRVWVDVMEWGSLRLREVLQGGHDSEALLGPSPMSLAGERTAIGPIRGPRDGGKSPSGLSGQLDLGSTPGSATY